MNNRENKIIRWGIIGCGKVVEEKSGPAFNRVPNSSLHAVMRRNIELAKVSASKLGATKCYDNVDELINDDMIDAIYIATPPGVHIEHAIACSHAKKPTYIEKPIARSYNESLEIVKAFEASNTPLFVAHYRRALPRFKEVKSVIDSGEIGKVHEVDFRLMRKYQPSDTSQSWLYNAEVSGGGKFFDIAPHTIDLMIFLFGEFESVFGLASNNNKDYLVEDIVTMTFKTTSGVLGTANFNLISTEKSDQMIIHGSNGQIALSVHGNAPIKIDGIRGTRYIDIKNPVCIEEPMIETVVNELLGLGTCPCSGRDALSTSKVIDMVLSDYYNGRNDRFWERPDSWNK
jgi:1,5-anhydro-D-fructose reductase (1,5-anhydro-D-mannitol-forming)